MHVLPTYNIYVVFITVTLNIPGDNILLHFYHGDNRNKLVSRNDVIRVEVLRTEEFKIFADKISSRKIHVPCIQSSCYCLNIQL